MGIIYLITHRVFSHPLHPMPELREFHPKTEVIGLRSLCFTVLERLITGKIPLPKMVPHVPARSGNPKHLFRLGSAYGQDNIFY